MGTSLSVCVSQLSSHENNHEHDSDSAIAGASLAAVNKFLLYDIINLNSKGSCNAVNAIAWSLAVDQKTGSLPLAATFSAVETLKMLELMVHCVRSDCGRMLGDESVWVLFETCFLIRQHWASVELLRHAAENTVAHLVLTVFSRISDSIKAVTSTNETTSTSSSSSSEVKLPYVVLRAHVSVYDDCITSWNITRNNINRAFSLF